MKPERGSEIVYESGVTSDGTPLLGGVWTLWDREGFPLEMAHLSAQGKGIRIDWCEAMADASRSNNCPALMKQVEAFLDEETIMAMKAGFVRMVESGKSFDQIISEKRGMVA